MAKTRANGALKPPANGHASGPEKGHENGKLPSEPPARSAKPEQLPAVPTGAEWTLDAGRPREILERLLDRPDAARLVRQTPVQPLYLFLRSLGLADAGELLPLCSSEQVQAFLDLDGWERDRVLPQRVFLWLAALRELGHEKLTAHLRRLDAELLTTLLGPRLRVYELNDEDRPPPEEAEGLFYTTPDRLYLVDIVPDPEGEPEGEVDRALLIRSLLEDLYRGGIDFARSIVMAARWDTGAETEERAYRFRSGRMADLGYVDYYEALKVYVLVDPAKAPPGTGTNTSQVAAHAPPGAATAGPAASADRAEPGAAPIGAAGIVGPRSAVWRELVPRLAEPDFAFGRAVAELSDEEQARLLGELLMLGNQVMAADRVELGDVEATRHCLQRVAGYLSLGLEFRLRQREPGVQPQPSPGTLLRQLPILYLFRLGHSLTVQLRKLAMMLVQSGLTTLIPKEDPASLLPAGWAVALAHLLRVRPLYALSLDPDAALPTPMPMPVPVPMPMEEERRASGESAAIPRNARPFGSLRELGRAAAFLEKIGLLDRFFTAGLGLRKETLATTLAGTSPGVREAQLSDVLGTMVANALLDRPAAMVPLMRRDLPELVRRASGGRGQGLAKAVRARIVELLQQRIRERAVSPAEEQQLWSEETRAFVEQSLDRLDKGLTALPSPLAAEAADAVPRAVGVILAG